MKRIKTASQLKLFLEAVAKEAVIKANNDLNENLQYEQEYFSRGLSKAETNRRNTQYSSLTPLVEIEEEEDDQKQKKQKKQQKPSQGGSGLGDLFGNEEPEQDADNNQQEPTKQEPAADAGGESFDDLFGGEDEGGENEDIFASDGGDQQPKPKKDPNNQITIPLVQQDPDFDDIVKSIGWLRSGGGIKGDVKQELFKYIEKLDSPGKKALYTMIASMAKIMHKAIDGSKGQDPEEKPLNLIIDDPEQERPEGDPEAVDPDDGTAPIKVGKSQSLNEMRKIVRALMER